MIDDVQVGGLRIAYERAGQGSPIVLLHGGFGLDHRAWRWQIAALADEFDVLAWDAPGCGRSSDPPAGWGSADYARCLAGVIRALGLGRPHVCGLSFGGTLALELYRRHPDVPRSLLLADSYAGWAGSLPPAVVEERLARVRREAELSPAQWAPGYVGGFFSTSAPAALREETLAMMADAHPAGPRLMAEAMGRADLRDVLPAIAVPTLLLWGAADERAPLSVGEDLHARIPGSELVVIPGAGHLSNAESPEQFTAAVRRFLRAADSAGGPVIAPRDDAVL